MSPRTNGHPLGLHRVIEPIGALPQSAMRLDASGPEWDNEVVLAVDTLNIDSASFYQLTQALGRDEAAFRQRIVEIVAERGKMQNPVTGSGGMLLGTVESVGACYDGEVSLASGDRVATLVSLTPTPLSLDRIEAIHWERDQVDVRGTAYLPPSAPLVVLPDDVDERLALSGLDVCGAPAQTERLVQDANRVLVLGAGKSGALCAAAAHRVLSHRGKSFAILGVDRAPGGLERLADLGLLTDWALADAQKPVDVLDTVLSMSGGHYVDVVINTCNVADTEMSAILPCRDRGKVYFFNMATDFAKAALGSEGLGKDVDLLIGNGYARGHAALTFDLLRSYPAILGSV